MTTQKKKRGRSARYETASLILRLALDLMAPGYGLTLGEIQQRYKLSRSTALRMLATLESWPEITFKYPGPQDDDDPRVKRWQIVGANLRDFSAPTPAELAALHRAAEAFKGAGLPRERTALASLSRKVAALASGAGIRTASDLEDQLRVRGLLMRPGPRPDSDADTIDKLDAALSSFRQVEIRYRSGGDEEAKSRTVCPFGILTGRWAYLIAFDPRYSGGAILPNRLKTYRIDRIQSLELLTTYERPSSPTLAEYAQRSFGVYQDRDEPSEIVWRFSPEVADEAERFQFHPTQLLEREEDGSLIVRFRAGGLREMVQHLFTWRGDVEVIAPEALRECWGKELALSAKALGRSRQATTVSRDRK